MNKSLKLPLILRYEPFGGSVFCPVDGTMVELDHDAFKVAVKVFANDFKARNSEEAAMQAELLELVDWTPGDQVRVVNVCEGFDYKVDYHIFNAPSLVDFQITNKCFLNCPHCYADSTPEGEHVPLTDIEHVINECYKCGVNQLALGGGEPLLHPDIIEVLKLAHAKGIVPNLSTNGMHFSDEILAALKEYCGAVALSMEGVGDNFDKWRYTGFARLQENLALLEKNNIPTVLQVTLSAENIAELDDIVSFCLSVRNLYGVIFLAYKPVGRGITYSKPLSQISANVVSRHLSKAMQRLNGKVKVGYDCCMTPAIIAANTEVGFVDESHLEGCSALRGSVGITTSLAVVPCTFLYGRGIGNLRESSLADIWQSGNAQSFRQVILRNSHQKSCTECFALDNCLGGCPAMPLVGCHNKS